jgi:hypothetical protein
MVAVRNTTVMMPVGITLDQEDSAPADGGVLQVAAGSHRLAWLARMNCLQRLLRRLEILVYGNERGDSRAVQNIFDQGLRVEQDHLAAALAQVESVRIPIDARKLTLVISTRITAFFVAVSALNFMSMACVPRTSRRPSNVTFRM